MWLQLLAWACLTWYIFIFLVIAIGYIRLFRHYSSQPDRISWDAGASSSSTPPVTVIRPCKGLEPYLYQCLSSTFRQDYPGDRLKVHFCVASRADPAYPIIQDVLRDFPKHNAKLFVEEEDTRLQSGEKKLGPNPKIRNMSQAYREAGVDDIIWILDCNIWVDRGACSRMVARLYGDGRRSASGFKLVHHVPVAVAVDGEPGAYPTSLKVTEGMTNGTISSPSSPPQRPHQAVSQPWYSRSTLGSRLEEAFLSSSHAKMYIAINTVALAPCINGKSNMFRRSHLDYLTSSPALPAHAKGSARSRLDLDGDGTNPNTVRLHGLDAFSHYICEDHLIGELFWSYPIPAAPMMERHGLVMGDIAFQPLAKMSLANYTARRVRWLRVRKFTVTLATFVEPGTESVLCSGIGAFAMALLVPLYFGTGWDKVGVSSSVLFATCWLTSMTLWASVDWSVYTLLHSGATIGMDGGDNHDDGSRHQHIPAFVHVAGPAKKGSRRPFREWLPAWLGRELLALPVWTWAFWCGTSVSWRGGRYRVGVDMRVKEL